MGHRCCSKQKVKRGLWSPEEDDKLVKHINTHGHGSWSSVPKLAGLQRCGKSCRLRWINYLRPDLKKGSFTEEEEQIIIDVHRILGNRWAQIAKHLPGRTDNEVKNFWNSCIKKKLMSQGLDPQTHYLISSHQTRASNSNNNYKKNNNNNNGVTSFVVSHENYEQEPISVFSMSSSSSQEITNVICSSDHHQDHLHHHQVPFDLTLPNAISTVDHHRYHPYQQHPSSSSSPATTPNTLKGQINSPHIDNNRKANINFHQQYNYNNNTLSSSFSTSVQNPSRSCSLPDHDFAIWGSGFEPSFETSRFLEANDQQSLEGHDHDHNDDGQMTNKQLQHNDLEKDIDQNIQNERSVEKYSSTFDLGFMESALMSDVMCTNDFGSMEYDISWNY